MTGYETTAAEQRLQPDPDKSLTNQADTSKAECELSWDDADQRERYRRKARWDRMIGKRGERYADCRLENFVCDKQEQTDAVETCELYAMNAREHYRNGAGLMLYGPRGTGKDHLLVGVAYVAIKEAGLNLHWENGIELFAAVRRAIQNNDVDAMVKNLAEYDVLAISDPIPPTGPLTEFQQEFLFRVIDRRYSNRKPTWSTVNVRNRTELEERIGASIADRLLEDATTIYCRWETNRKTLREAAGVTNAKHS